MNLFQRLTSVLAGGLFLLSGCKSTIDYDVNPCGDFKIDGKLTSPEWKKSKVYSLQAASNDKRLGGMLHEKGNVRMLASKEYLYIGLCLDDSDVVAQGTSDQTHLYLMGDTIELFFKSGDDTYYWEMYGTPNELKTTFFYPSRSYVFLLGSASPKPEFEVRSNVEGTLNNWRSPDRGWTIEFKIPIKTFEQYGAKFRSDTDWRFLITRQNYSRMLPVKESSTIPAIEKPDFHIIEQYGKLHLKGSVKQ